MDPYCLFHSLRPHDYRPIDDPHGEPRPPVYPDRIKAFLYACAMVAEHESKAV